MGLLHHVALGAQPAEGEAGAAAGFLDQALGGEGPGYALHGIGHRQHVAGGELLQVAAGVHQGRGVGQEIEIRHQAVEFGAAQVRSLAGLGYRGVDLLQVAHEAHEIGFALRGFGHPVMKKQRAGLAGAAVQPAAHALENTPFLALRVQDYLGQGYIVGHALEKRFGTVVLQQVLVFYDLGLVLAQDYLLFFLGNRFH